MKKGSNNGQITEQKEERNPKHWVVALLIAKGGKQNGQIAEQKGGMVSQILRI
jgi:hypothetical protein